METHRSRTRSRTGLLLGLLLIALFAVGCAQSSDPTTWEDALAEGNVERNFLNACEEADEGATSDTAALADYCRCSFNELQETFADDFARFKAVDDALRSEPEAINDPTLVEDADTRADVQAAALVIRGCETTHLV
ncbi:MAG: hypothetical protein AAF548_19605 [Actinomycetota bacterium]